MRSRWTILVVLFVARAAMAVQFQSIAAIAPELGKDLNANLADIGVLIGLYFAPGVALALPGGAIGKRFGDKAVVLAGLALMLAGEILLCASSSWSVQITGRLISGVGGVLLNVLMTKMVVDWFAGRQIATAMAIFINSWPIGIALTLLVLPLIQAEFGIAGTQIAVMALIAAALALVGLFYRRPSQTAAPASAEASRLAKTAGWAVLLAGAIWAFYNVGFAMIFSFAPSMLVERGWSTAAAGSAVSIVLWLAALSVPIGGYLADRTGSRNAMLAAGCLAFAALVLALWRGSETLPTLIALGLVCGLPAGAIMSLPTRALTPSTRALGMGLFYTVYYATMLVAPWLGGKFALWAGSAGAALGLGSAALLACPILLWEFERRLLLPARAATQAN
ncbi:MULTISPECIES: MFS transporter [unclassified Mesorhizobium]|uniref:MFS transporter n=1 Tax=unclassified Mesorhizobium TaxID=325217 RepID=UPI000FCC3D48|nr:MULTISPECIES: MFS transporter [unclassified Mesorhizobium]TGP24327.1 MFS transporter [Mesorhizobium sp. M1D.F.Ca.ET.231.01.1.1]TGP35087.1 MFS transporter [Mesorhizobium sp. M1D.F.Ca.ET.234.01.1.1]TGS49108.1 MFS transporter [Mesorhizobium sp. M1D.F.Ca.ET.184.01.1.1]TGS63307.1 MFS transporter [Mesorhizobium sp. M1D.F.Ca.ET.183.01.1.1]